MAGILMTLVEYSYISESVQARGTLVYLLSQLELLLV